MPTSNTILFLGPDDSPLLQWLRESGETVVHTAERINHEFLQRHNIGFLVSFGYRHIIKKDMLDLLPGRAINLHISLLPWNRGADPNLWSWVDNTPKGVTIHYLDEGVDTGDIIYQKEVLFDPAKETLASSYATLQSEIVALFKAHWQEIKSGACPRIPQRGVGSTHRVKDKEPLASILNEGWDTSVSLLRKHHTISE
ncbi:MAG: formyltransferase family protein [Candidatus Zixiibacteriota bacterium]